MYKVTYDEFADYDDDDFLTVEPFKKKPSFKSEGYRKNKNDAIRHKRQEKERERERLVRESESVHADEDTSL